MTTATSTTTQARRTATVNLPLVTAEFRAPRMPHVPRPRMSVPHVPRASVPHPSMPHVSAPRLPSRREIVDLGHGVSGFLPPRDQLALYGGLGAAAALGVLDWPVAIAVGAATAVARRRIGRQVEYTGRPPAELPAPAQPARRTTERKTTARKTARKTTAARPAAKKSV
jgi:hypothetical protein